MVRYKGFFCTSCKLMSVRVFGGATLQLKPYQVLRSIPAARRSNRTAYCAVPSPGAKMDKEKEKRPPAEHDASKTIADAMTDSFGEAYATRCDEEGFGGVYGGNDPVINHPEYDKSQGSEVKEKEKARNSPHGAPTS